MCKQEPLNCSTKVFSSISNYSKHSAQHSLNTHVTVANDELYTLSKLAVRTVLVHWSTVNVYEVKLIYHREPRSITLKESVTYCATVELFLRGIDVCQMSATRIAFETDQQRTLGILYLSGSQDFTPVCI